MISYCLPVGGRLVNVQENWVNLISQRRSTEDSVVPMKTGTERHSLDEKSKYTKKILSFLYLYWENE